MPSFPMVWRRFLCTHTSDFSFFNQKPAAIIHPQWPVKQVTRFNFHLFPRDELKTGMPCYSFSCQPSYLASMDQDDFDFNLYIYDGNPHLFFFLKTVRFLINMLLSKPAFLLLSPLRLFFVSEKLVIGVGYDCNPMVFAADGIGSWSFVRFLDEKSQHLLLQDRAHSNNLSNFQVSSSVHAALTETFGKFYGSSKQGTSNDKSRGGVHDNCINCIVPFKTSSGSNKMTSFSTSGLDGKVVIFFKLQSGGHINKIPCTVSGQFTGRGKKMLIIWKWMHFIMSCSCMISELSMGKSEGVFWRMDTSCMWSLWSVCSHENQQTLPQVQRKFQHQNTWRNKVDLASGDIRVAKCIKSDYPCVPLEEAQGNIDTVSKFIDLESLGGVIKEEWRQGL
ncbi:unnamed protein product [Lactuca virosa]|uniref:Uncharacterized protein n=1 Tax=Lactuca virosa TaxID=75947 RepID=A0AAU9NGD8_9ASTR|nr:unnamed protein product [Lactuca virosa]